MKSSRSMIVDPSPSGVNPANTLNPITHGILKIMIRIRLTSVLFFLDHPNKSISKEIIFSNTATSVVNAAKLKNRKNNPPHTHPPATCAKIFGIVINIRLGPAPGSIPYAKHAGIIMKPAISATIVSSTVIFTASPNNLWSFSI